jgi:hypothetical protein
VDKFVFFGNSWVVDEDIDRSQVDGERYLMFDVRRGLGCLSDGSGESMGWWVGQSCHMQYHA